MKTKSLTVCIDANVYISAFAFGGNPLKIIDLALDRKFYLITCSHILMEVHKNLIKKLEANEAEVNGFLKDIGDVVTIYEPQGVIDLIDHKKDSLVLETAILGNADVLVTGDKKDLLPLKVFQGVIIESPSIFLTRFYYNNGLN